ncbi:MAG: hypothetical protein KBD01_14665 [Acidobacteria bacterium]|nr:hypothetical protein [Acidobacteriota bacterium]
MNAWLTTTLVLLAASAGSARAGSRPDFSGTFKADFASSKLEVAPPESSVFVIVHRDPVFRATRTHVVDGKPDTFIFELTCGAPEQRIVHGGVEWLSRLYWDGDVLVFDSKVRQGRKTATNVVRYQLSADGGMVVAHERFRGSDRGYDNIWILRRMP